MKYIENIKIGTSASLWCNLSPNCIQGMLGKVLESNGKISEIYRNDNTENILIWLVNNCAYLFEQKKDKWIRRKKERTLYYLKSFSHWRREGEVGGINNKGLAKRKQRKQNVCMLIYTCISNVLLLWRNIKTEKYKKMKWCDKCVECCTRQLLSMVLMLYSLLL